MPEFRLCCLRTDGRLESEERIEAPNDDGAIRIALEMNKAAQCELWQDGRFVAAVGANKHSGVRSFRFDYEK